MALTKNEKRYLSEAAKDGRKLSTIANRLSVTTRRARQIMAAHYPNWKPKEQKRATWSEEEIDYLRANYNSASWEEIRRNLKFRPETSIRRKAQVIGCPRRTVTPAEPVSLYETDINGAAKPKLRRKCLNCSEDFDSAGPHNRMCDRCRDIPSNLPDYRLAV